MSTSEPLTTDATTVVPSIRPTGLRKRNVVLMILLILVTFGLYYPIWFLRRRNALNRLDSPRKLQRWPFVVVLAFFVVQFIVSIATGGAPPEETISAGASLLFSVLQLAVGIGMASGH